MQPLPNFVNLQGQGKLHSWVGPRVICSSCRAPSQADAVRFLKKSNYRLEAAVDAFFGDSNAVAAAANPPPARESSAASMATKLNALFDKYKGMARTHI